MMTTKDRRPFSVEEKKLLWERWRQGDSIAEIGRALCRVPPGVRHILMTHGGISPPQRTRSARTLQLHERETISRGLSAGQSIRSMAQILHRSPSTLSREIHRNGGADHYRALAADQAAWQRAHRPKPGKLVRHKALAQQVAHRLKQHWSPEQIAGWLKQQYPDQPERQVSHETIYRSLYVQARGALKKALTQYLRRHHKLRHGRSAQDEKRGQIPEAVSIRQRPPSIEDRAVPGHWEGDLLMGSHNSAMATLVERQTRYVMLIKVRDKRTETVIAALIKHIQKLPRELSRSLTWDRGAELKGHRHFSVATKVDVYFCDPSSPWQRGSNENTNGLLRQYFPKGTDLSIHSQQHLDTVARQLNERPRKTLGFDTPAERFAACVAATR